MKSIKNFLLIFFIYFLSVTNLYALNNIYLDLSYIRNSTDYTKNQNGFKLLAAYKISNNININLGSFYSYYIQNPNLYNETEYNQFQSQLGFEYLYYIPNFPIILTLNINAGYIKSKIFYNNSFPDDEISDSGLSYSFGLGSYFLITQKLAPFVNIIYSDSVFFREFKDESIRGLQIIAGIRITINGTNKSIFDNYE